MRKIYQTLSELLHQVNNVIQKLLSLNITLQNRNLDDPEGEGICNRIALWSLITPLVIR
jgi:hypothetical protein